jgi:hypothetical protein
MGNRWVKPKLPRGVVIASGNEPGHQHSEASGTQINATTVRWECSCGATKDEYDPPVRG